jgi:hypothetical protein
MKSNSRESALEVTLREKRSSLSPELVKGLKEDLAASKKSPGEIVGLDFDPFLNAQDIAERYLVGNVTPKGDHYWVEVFGVWNGQKNSNPDVIPELAFENGHWIFINFHYGKTDIPVNENLVSILQVLKKDRQKSAKREGHDPSHDVVVRVKCYLRFFAAGLICAALGVTDAP